MRTVRRSRASRVCAGLCAFVLCVAAGCSGSDESGDDTGPVLAGAGEEPLAEPVEVAPLPPVQPTAATSVSTTAAPLTSATTPATVASTTTSARTTTSRAATTTTVSTAPATPTTPGPPCDIGRIVTETGTDYDAITPGDLRCVDLWATWIGRPDDQFADGFFAVALWTGASWELANLGTAGICADAGVPTTLWDRLGCLE